MRIRLKFNLTGAIVFNIAYISLFVSEIWCNYTNLDDLVPSRIISAVELFFKVLFLLAVVVKLMFFQGHNRKSVAICMVVGAIFLISYVVCRSTALLFLVLLIFSSKDIDFDAFGKMATKLIVITIVIMALLSLSGLIGMTVKERTYADTTRYALGFTHPNLLSILAFVAISFYLYINKTRNEYRAYILGAMVCAVVYFITNSSTLLYISASFFLLNFGRIFLERHRTSLFGKYSRLVVRTLVICIVIVVIGISIYLFNHPQALTGSLKTLGSRFKLAQKYLQAYGIHLWGNKIVVGSRVTLPNVGTGYYYLDNGYFRILIQYGILVSGIALYVLWKFLKNIIQGRRWKLLITIGCLCLYFFTEQKIMLPYCNFYVILLGTVLYNHKRCTPSNGKMIHRCECCKQNIS